MNLLGKRYFVIISLIFLGFTGISFVFNGWIFFAIFAFILTFFFLILRNKKKTNKNFNIVLILMLLASLVGVLRTDMLIVNNNSLADKYSGTHDIYGYVSEVSLKSDYITEHIVKVESIDGEKSVLEIIFVTDFKSELSRGDFFRCSVDISTAEDYSNARFLKNSSSYDYPLICTLSSGGEIEHLDREIRADILLGDLNSKLSSTLKAIMGTKHGSLASALLLGNRELLNDEVLRDFKRAGVYHMLALSGLHVAILIGIFEFVLKRLFVAGKVRAVLLVLVSLFYIALTGFALSACRSMLMLWTLYFAFVFAQRRDALTSLFIAITVIVLLSPSALLDIGLQLSFLSTFGVIVSAMIGKKLTLFKRKTDNKLKKAIYSVAHYFLLLNITSACVFIFTLPVIAYWFGEVSLATFFSNLFMGILCEAFMIMSIITLLTSFSMPLSSFCAQLANTVGGVMTDIIEKISDGESVMLSLRYDHIEILVFGVFASTLLLLAIKLRRKWLIAIPSIVFTLLLFVSIFSFNIARANKVRAEFVRGDAVVISSNEGVYIIDSSSGSYGALYDAIGLTKENCFTEIEGIVLTHYHSEHSIALSRICSSYKVRSVILPEPQSYREYLIMFTIVDRLKDENTAVLMYESGEELDLLSGTLTVSDRAYTATSSHPSVVFSFSYGDSRITLIEPPYFETYLDACGSFDEYISNSDYLIFGSEGKAPDNEYRIFDTLKFGAEITFCDTDMMLASDLKHYLDDFTIYFGATYKKYDLK